MLQILFFSDFYCSFFFFLILMFFPISIILMFFSAFFSASETAFTSFNRTKMKTLAADGKKRAALAMKLADNYDKLLSTILVGNNIVNIAMSSLATLLFIDLLAGTSAASSAAIASASSCWSRHCKTRGATPSSRSV